MALSTANNKYFISGPVSVMVARSPYGIDESTHKHDFIEFVYMLKGECLHVIDGKEYRVNHGDMLVINYNQTHSIKGDKSTAYVNILMKPEYISASLANADNAFSLLNLSEFMEFAEILDKSKIKIRFSGEEQKRIEAIINTLLHETESAEPGHELYIRSQFNILLITIFRKMSLSLDMSFKGVSDELLSYIRMHCSEKLSLTQLAKMCSYNVAYFSRIFKEFAGVNFTTYLRGVRIEKAMELIENTDMNITDIAYEVGYTNRTRFFAHFRSVCGMSPLDYKKAKKR